MAYFKVGSTDLSPYVSGLTVTKRSQYNAQMNAAGNTVIDYINEKRTIEVEIIPLLESELQTVLGAISFANSVSYREPSSGTLVTGVSCFCDEQEIQYFTIQTGKVMYQEMKLTFQEL